MHSQMISYYLAINRYGFLVVMSVLLSECCQTKSHEGSEAEENVGFEQNMLFFHIHFFSPILNLFATKTAFGKSEFHAH